MTCVCAVVNREGNGVTMGADCGSVSPAGLVRRTRYPKVHARTTPQGVMLIGYSGSYRFGQILGEHLIIPEFIQTNVENYLIIEMVPAIVEALVSHGWPTAAGVGYPKGHPILIGFMGRIFEIDAEWQVSEREAGYAAIGSGISFALGALFVLERSTKTDADRVEVALCASAAFRGEVKGPFRILSTKGL